MNKERFEQQVEFILTCDRLKAVERRTYNLDATRRENAAEHSWQLALMALLLSEYAEAAVDTARVVRMVLVHDIVEVDAGDTYVYAPHTADEKKERETAAADRLFGLLPDDQEQEMRALWDEFEEGATAEARFAATLDRLMPLLLNYHTRGRSWQEHEVVDSQVRERNLGAKAGSEALWRYAESLIDRAVEEGLLKKAST